MDSKLRPVVLIDDDGTEYWYFNGMLHRIDGPAVEGFDGRNEWWINGKKLTLMEFVNHDLVSDETAQKVLTKWI